MAASLTPVPPPSHCLPPAFLSPMSSYPVPSPPDFPCAPSFGSHWRCCRPSAPLCPPCPHALSPAPWLPPSTHLLFGHIGEAVEVKQHLAKLIAVDAARFVRVVLQEELQWAGQIQAAACVTVAQPRRLHLGLRHLGGGRGLLVGCQGLLLQTVELHLLDLGGSGLRIDLAVAEVCRQ